MRLIDADQLKELLLHERDAIPKTIQERYGFGVGRPNNHGNSMRGGIRKALRCMEQCITIDPEELRPRGKWIEQTVRGALVLVCSVCHCGSNLFYEQNYCPNCGAKMEV